VVRRPHGDVGYNDANMDTTQDTGQRQSDYVIREG